MLNRAEQFTQPRCLTYAAEALTLGRMPTRLAKIMKRLDITQAQLAELAGATQQHVSRLAQKDALSEKWVRTFARVLDISEDELREPKMVPVIGRVGAGARVYPFDEDELPIEHQVSCPRGMNPKTTRALLVKGDSMYQEIDDGWYVFFDAARAETLESVLGQRCVVDLADGARLIKRVRRGTAANRVTLLSTNAPPIEDAEIKRIARAVALPPDLVADS